MIKLARFLLSNVFTLVVSLVLAILIWVNASQANDPTQDRWLQITLEYVGQPDQSVLLSTRRQSVQIFFQGPASIVNDVDSNDFSAVVDLSQVSFGQEELVDVRRHRTGDREFPKRCERHNKAVEFADPIQ